MFDDFCHETLSSSTLNHVDFKHQTCFFLAVNIWILLPIMEHLDILPTWGLEDLSASVKSLHLATRLLPD
jgi:hypothetical protein